MHWPTITTFVFIVAGAFTAFGSTTASQLINNDGEAVDEANDVEIMNAREKVLAEDHQTHMAMEDASLTQDSSESDHQEARVEDQHHVTGQCHAILPDGRTQSVIYSCTPDGFKAIVQYHTSVDDSDAMEGHVSAESPPQMVSDAHEPFLLSSATTESRITVTSETPTSFTTPTTEATISTQETELPRHRSGLVGLRTRNIGHRFGNSPRVHGTTQSPSPSATPTSAPEVFVEKTAEMKVGHTETLHSPSMKTTWKLSRRRSNV